MAGTTTRRRPGVTAKTTLIQQIIDGLDRIAVALNVKYSKDPGIISEDRLNDYNETIDTFSVAKLRANSNELIRISAMLNALMRDIKDPEINDKIRNLRALIAVAEREFEYSE